MAEWDKLPDVTGSIATARKNPQTNSSDDQGKPSDNSGGALQSKSAGENLRRVLDERMTYSQAMEKVSEIVSCYPNGGRDAGGSYLGAIANVLTSYPRQVVIACADPKRGIVRTAKFLPTVAEVVVWCENETRPLRDQCVYQELVAKQLRERDEPRAPRMTIDELKAKYGDWTKFGGQNTETKEARLERLYPEPAVRDSDRELKASPYLVKALKDKADLAALNRKLDAPKHWSEE